MKRFTLPFTLFFIAFIVFYAGLGAGLIYNPTLGSLLWLLAAAVGVAGLVLLIRRLDHKEEQ